MILPMLRAAQRRATWEDIASLPEGDRTEVVDGELWSAPSPLPRHGFIEGAVTSAADMDAIAELPSREVLLARLLGSMMSPISGLAIVLDQIAKKQAE